MNDDKIFLAVPYHKKETAKEMGAWWDNEEKLWYAPEKLNPRQKKALVKAFGQALDSVLYINVPFDDKDVAKGRGCKWDSRKHCWYIPRGCAKKDIHFLRTRYNTVKFEPESDSQ